MHPLASPPDAPGPRTLPLWVVFTPTQRGKAGSGRCAEHRPAHHTARVLALRSSMPEHHLQPTRWLLLLQRSPRTKKSNSNKSNSKGEKTPGGHGAALLNVPSLAAKIVNFPAGRALIIYYWQRVQALALPWRTVHPCTHGFPAGILERSSEGATSWERDKTQRDFGTELLCRPSYVPAPLSCPKPPCQSHPITPDSLFFL